MGDLISRSALLEKRFAMHSNFLGKVSVVAVKDVENAPAVDAETVIKSLPYVKEALEMAKQTVAPVVRCKDCKHFCPYEGEEHKGDCDELVGLESCVYEDDFCSYGERRGDDEG